MGEKLVIDCGHYTYTKGPTELDILLFEKGIKKSLKSPNSKLLILVDDRFGIQNNEERKKINIEKIPNKYEKLLKEHKVNKKQILIKSQNYFLEKGRKWLRTRNISRSSVTQCELIVAALTRWKEMQGFTKNLVIYDELKTDQGLNIIQGIQKAKELFNTTIKNEIYIYESIKNYNKY
jgi:hypothetical protein